MPSREQRVRVWRGELKKTTGGLTKDDLVKNKKGKIVSRRKSRQAAEQNNLGEWLRDKGDRFEDTPAARAAKGLAKPKVLKAKPKAPEPKPVRPPPPKLASNPAREKLARRLKTAGVPVKPKVLKPKPKVLKAKPKVLKPKPKVLKAKPKVLKAKPKAAKAPKVLKAKGKIHAGEPQPEYVRFKEDLGRSSLKKAAMPNLYSVRKDPLVESAPIARNENVKFGEVSVRNIRPRRRRKRVDYSKYF